MAVPDLEAVFDRDRGRDGIGRAIADAFAAAALACVAAISTGPRYCDGLLEFVAFGRGGRFQAMRPDSAASPSRPAGSLSPYSGQYLRVFRLRRSPTFPPHIADWERSPGSEKYYAIPHLTSGGWGSISP